MPSGFRRFGYLSFINQYSKEQHRLASTASDRKGAKLQDDISWFYPHFFSSTHQSKAEFKDLDDTEVFSSDFPGLISAAISMTSMAQQPQWPKWPQQPHFIKKKYSSSLEPKWPIPVPFCGMVHQKSNFSLISDTLPEEAVEASRCHFFENWLIKHKCAILLKPLGTII